MKWYSGKKNKWLLKKASPGKDNKERVLKKGPSGKDNKEWFLRKDPQERIPRKGF